MTSFADLPGQDRVRIDFQGPPQPGLRKDGITRPQLQPASLNQGVEMPREREQHAVKNVTCCVELPSLDSATRQRQQDLGAAKTIALQQLEMPRRFASLAQLQQALSQAQARQQGAR